MPTTLEQMEATLGIEEEEQSSAVNGHRADPRFVSIDDATLLERARRARDGAKFVALFDRGDIRANGGADKTASGADQALANLLAF